MSPASLREARPDELDAIGEMMVAAYAEFTPPNPPPLWRAYEDEIRDVRSRLAAATLIVAEDAGRLVGAVTYYSDATKEMNTSWPASWAVFRLLAVHPAARGRGIGRLLTEECIRRARAAGSAAIGLHTTHLMNVARAMYERMGFVRVPELDFLPGSAFPCDGIPPDAVARSGRPRFCNCRGKMPQHDSIPEETR